MPKARRHTSAPPSCSSAFELADAGRPRAAHVLRRHAPAARPRRPASWSSPPVLFLDEPTTGLDPRSRLELWDVISELRDRGHDDRAHHAVPGGGRPAGRQHQRHRRRPHHRRGHRRRAEGARSAATWSTSPRRPLAHGDAAIALAHGAFGSAEHELVGRRDLGRCGAGHGGRHRAHRGAAGARRRRASPSPTSRCAGPRSTTCSSPSPATRRRTRPRGRPQPAPQPRAEDESVMTVRPPRSPSTTRPAPPKQRAALPAGRVLADIGLRGPAQPPQDACATRGSSCSPRSSRSCSSSCSPTSSARWPAWRRHRLQGLRRARGAHPDDDVRRDELGRRHRQRPARRAWSTGSVRCPSPARRSSSGGR